MDFPQPGQGIEAPAWAIPTGITAPQSQVSWYFGIICYTVFVAGNLSFVTANLRCRKQDGEYGSTPAGTNRDTIGSSDGVSIVRAILVGAIL